MRYTDSDTIDVSCHAGPLNSVSRTIQVKRGGTLRALPLDKTAGKLQRMRPVVLVFALGVFLCVLASGSRRVSAAPEWRLSKSSPGLSDDNDDSLKPSERSDELRNEREKRELVKRWCYTYCTYSPRKCFEKCYWR